ncbi:MAG: CRISPR-associated helicase Cas3', partial [Chloroflexota bacterium]|nr:CRISPR-associated helicase Cas3' [Chloroflexota bacterium]
MRPEQWPDWIEETLLAKSADRGKGGKPESMAMHTWLALSRLADFVRLRAPLAGQLGHPRLWHCLYWGVFLHDFGKAMPGFQGVLRGDKALREHWSGHRHEVFSLAFLDWITSGLNEEERLWIAAAIVSHHKDAADLRQAYPLPEPGEPDTLLLEQLDGLPTEHIRGLHRWLAECGWAWAQTLGLDAFGVAPVQFVPSPEASFHKEAAQRIRHWLRAYRKFVKQLNRQNDPAVFVPLLALRGMLINSDHSASAHASALPSVTFRAEDVIEKRGIPREKLYQHQNEAENTDGSVLLTAPTGSGKTEAALLWAARQKQDGHAPPRLFYTLPYQASMNAMLLRLQEIFDDKNLVGLQHGRSLLALYRQLMDKNYDPRQAQTEAKWIRNLARLNYPPVRVFSPYQMLKAMYRLKGYEAQLTDYHNAIFIFDEIHAYETKRMALILKTIEYLRRHYHARFFVMSATFPTLIKDWLRETLDLGSDDEIKATGALFEKFQRHRLEIIEGEIFTPDNFARIFADARAGKSVLVVCNIVDRAQEAYKNLKDLKNEGIEVELLHGRFNLRDRLDKERIVQDATGSKSDKRRPIVLVATQVVEVSLDIDLNTIYTEPAPLEALVQRFGRINRRGKIDGLAPVHVFTQPDDGQIIYNERLIAGTLKVLRREQGKPVDESAVGQWLDEIYEGEVAEEWKTEFTKTAQEFEAAIVNTLRPFQSDRMLRDQFYKAFDGIQVLPDCHWDKYEDLQKTFPLEASELLVSISWGRYHQL